MLNSHTLDSVMRYYGRTLSRFSKNDLQLFLAAYDEKYKEEKDNRRRKKIQENTRKVLFKKNNVK